MLAGLARDGNGWSGWNTGETSVFLANTQRESTICQTLYCCSTEIAAFTDSNKRPRPYLLRAHRTQLGQKG